MTDHIFAAIEPLDIANLPRELRSQCLRPMTTADQQRVQPITPKEIAPFVEEVEGAPRCRVARAKRNGD
jgi:hypothetical protein